MLCTISKAMRRILIPFAIMILAAVPLPLRGQSVPVLPGLTITGNTFSYNASDGLVSGIIRIPSGSGPFPAVLISHGKGGTASNFSDQQAQTLVSWGFLCIGPNYTHQGSASNPPDNEGYCPENSRRARRCIEILAATPGADMARLALFGHSMGSFITAGLAGEIPAQIKAACISAGGTSGTTDTSFASPATQEVQGITAPFLMFHGTADTTVLPSQSVNLQNVLNGNAVPAKRLLYQGINHDIVNSNVKRADIHAIMRAWFTQHGVLGFAGNTPPGISAASAVTVTHGNASSPIPLTLADSETAASSLTLSAFTTDDARLPNSSIALGGSGANRTMTLTPPAGQTGTVEVALVVHDGQLSAATYLQVTIENPAAPVSNFRPEISWVADQRTTPGTAVNGIAFTVGDVETSAASLTVTASSSNTTLLPASGITFGGSGASRTVSLVPASGQSGLSTITLTVSDGTRSCATAFTLTVAATVSGNTPPTIQSIAGEVLPAGSVFGSLPLIVKDTEQAESSLTLSATSNNPTLVPVSGIALGGQNYGRTIQVTPVPGQSGRTTITVTVSDGTNTSSIAFVLDVVSGNTLPSIHSLPGVVNAPLGSTPVPVSFTVADAESTPGDLRITATSSNPTLIPNSNISLGGSGADRTLTLTPADGQTGAATVTVLLRDADLTRRAELLYVVTDGMAAAAQFSRPRGVFVLDSGGAPDYTTTFGKAVSKRDANIRSHSFVDGFTLRVAWSDVESGTTPGAYDFFIIQNVLSKLPAGQKLSLIIVPSEPDYIATTSGVETWNDAGTVRATPWDSYLQQRRRALLAAMGSVVSNGIALRHDPRLDLLDPYLPGGFTGVRDPNSIPLRNITGYTRQKMLQAVRTELRALQDEFPGKFVQIGFWPVTDNENASYGGVTAADWIRQQLLAEFNGLTRPRVGFFMENLAARRNGPNVEPFSATPVTGFGSALFNSREATWNGFQMLGSWTRPFNDGHVTNTLHGTPNDAIEFAFNAYRAEYHEIYIGDIDNAAFQPALQRWHDFYATAATTSADSDEDQDGLPFAWERQFGLSPTIENHPNDDSDGDGIPLLLEYAFHQSPASSSTAGLPTGTITVNSGDGLRYLHYHYLRRTDAPQLSYTVETSSDFATWQSGSSFTQEIGTTATGDGVTQLVTVRILPAITGVNPAKFARLRVMAH
jgi:dienelactone hydrolase